MTRSKKVLVVDDKSDIVEIVSFCLLQEGFEVSAAFDGRQALDKARAEEPDVIVLDVMLPHENGYQVARFLREDYKEGRISKLPRIMLLTARAVMDREREEFLQTWSGVDAVMYKPFELEELVQRVIGLLRSLPSTEDDSTSSASMAYAEESSVV
jgi:DNA-binding response OmpR family regulator